MRDKTINDIQSEYKVKLRFLLLTLFLVLFYTTLLFSATVYIDPTYTGSTQNGTITNPYRLWSQATITSSNTYLQKRGTTYNTTGNIWIFQKSGVTLGAYGTGDRPKIISSGTSNKVVDFGNSSNCIIRDLEISSTGNSTMGIYFAEGCANNLIDNCEIHNCEWGIRITTTGAGNRILNSIIHTTGDDGVYIKDVPNIEIGYCNIYNVNRKWFINPDQSYSPGDCIQISSVNNLYYNIHHNTLDHTSTGNKFCFISYGVNYSGLIEYNTIIGNAASSTSCIYFHATTGTVTVRNNILKNGSYGIYSYVDNLQLSYNKIINNTYGIRVLTGHNLTALNNVFYGNTGYSISSLGSTVVTSRNNAFYLTGSSARVYTTSGTLVSNYNNFNIEQSGFINGYNSLASWRTASGNDLNSFVANPMFVNPANADFTLQTGSPCINTGSNVNLPLDYFGTSVPQGNAPDIGLHEFINNQGGSNLPPVINNQSFQTIENSANATIIGTIVASDPNAGQTLTYTITSGNTNNAFAINPTTGVLSVANNQALNYETTPSFPLTVRVTDNGTGNLWAQATVTVQLSNVNENPAISNQGFSVLQNAANGTIVGTVVASDPDQGQTLSYSITAGNTNTAFAINATSGRITVANSNAVQGSFNLTVRATDNGTPVLYSSAAIEITVTTAVNQTPVISNQTFSAIQNAANGTLVGTVVASDPNAGQTLTYSITGGNPNTTFAINSSSGILMVTNSATLTGQAFSLTVRATDNGSPSLWAQATVTVNVVASGNQAPVIANQTFSIIQYSPNGTLAGTVVASDPNAGQAVSFFIISGNSNNAFSINGSNGNLSVNNSSALSSQTFTLIVRATDNGTPNMYSQATITVNVTTPPNQSPVIANQSFSVSQNATNGTLIGSVIASDPNTGQTLIYSITAGNTNSAFAINASSGNLIVNNAAAITAQSYTLTVRVTDNGTPSLWAQALITISVTNGNSAPLMPPQSFTKQENPSAGSFVGSVVASDPDPDNWLTFSILSGNTNSAFKIQSNTGRIFVNNAGAVNYESQQVYNLLVRAIDNLGASTQAIMTINILDVNETPVVQNSSFTVNRSASNGTVVGQVTATDPDQGQSLTFSITQGNTNGIFGINQNSGSITVVNAAALNVTNNNTFTLTVRALDNGTPALSSNGSITINVIRYKDSDETEIVADSDSQRLNLLLKVYPNPSTDGNFTIELAEETSEETTLIITDLKGIKIREERFSGKTIFTLDLSNMPKGIYLMHAQNAQKHTVSKLIRQ